MHASHTTHVSHTMRMQVTCVSHAKLASDGYNIHIHICINVCMNMYIIAVHICKSQCKSHFPLDLETFIILTDNSEVYIVSLDVPHPVNARIPLVGTDVVTAVTWDSRTDTLYFADSGLHTISSAKVTVRLYLRCGSASFNNKV